MSKPFAARLLQPLSSTVCSSCRTTLTRQPLLSTRPFSSTPAVLARDFQDPLASLSKLASLSTAMEDFKKPLSGFESLIDPRHAQDDGLDDINASLQKEIPMYHFHVYATKHNTHITLTRPNREPLISVSCGNIGFKKAARGTYDSAYQLAAYMMSRIQDKGLLTEIRDMEVIFRGFGPGREAVSKVIMSSEGRNVRTKIKKLTDATRLKFGGLRSPRMRRLG
ncbi:translational machinery component [Mytilinidion resinicola]|uniref:Small ribosomal subunit protein uS11m n=1 Tax=Mytilinidion resinicola TaxID=574789 RepID=A0A6A6YA96_9PEZI|nr:translational machinery component [Mytilinidion resinicola]KAF2804747.1 translational machinery component [Mytilinidion resinicola]